MNKEEIKLCEIINSYAIRRIGNLSLQEEALNKYKTFCIELIQENKELKEEINKLTVESTEWEDRYYRLQDKWDVSIIKLENKNKELHNKIDKLSNENQSLRTRIKTIKRRRKHQTQKLNKYKTAVTKLRNALEKKNNKKDKAINYIKEQGCYDEDCNVFCDDLNYYAIPRLLEILEKDSDVDG